MRNYFINGYQVIPSKNIILYRGSSISITPKMMAVLNVLSEANGETVTKETILDIVWADVSVSELVLSRAIADLRKVFNETAKNAALIKTISKVGFCLDTKIVFEESLIKTPEKKKRFVVFGLMAVLLSCGFGLVILNQSLSLPSPLLLQIIPNNLTADLNIESQPRYSNSGNLIAYVVRKTPFLSSLRIYSTKTSENKELWTEEGVIESPVFSPDEKSIAFNRRSQTECKLIIMQLDTQKSRTTDCIDSYRQSIDWSSSGKWLLTGHADRSIKTEGLASVNVENFAVTLLAKPETYGSGGYMFARLSADSKKIAFAYLHRPSTLWVLSVMDIETAEIESLFETNNPINQVLWSNDENILYYAIGGGQQGGIWQFDNKLKQNKLLYSGEIRDLDYSEKLNQFVMVEEKRDLNIWSLDINGAPDEIANTKVTFATKVERQPEINIKTNRLAYISNQSNAYNLWVKDLATGKEIQWTEFTNGVITDIKWSADGSTIYFNHSTGGRNLVFSIRHPKEIKMIFEPTNNYKLLNFSEDEHFIFYTSDMTGAWATYRKDLLDNKSEIIVDTLVEKLCATKDAFYYKSPSSFEFYKASYIDGILKTEEVSALRGGFSEWLIINDNIYYLARIGEAPVRFYRYNLVTGKNENLSEVDTSNTLGNLEFSVTADETKIFYTRLEAKSTDLISLDIK